MLRTASVQLGTSGTVGVGLGEVEVELVGMVMVWTRITPIACLNDKHYGFWRVSSTTKKIWVSAIRVINLQFG